MTREEELVALLERERIAGLCAELGAAREARGLTRAAVGERIGVSRAAVSKWELGHHLPGATHLSAWARSLGYELALYVPLTSPDLSRQTAVLLDEVIDVLARALLEEDDDVPAESTTNAQGAA